ncbi:MAG: DUF805 domain-containing protein [Zoogloeaceae bacterium]|jgi:uncharacterized membrane protein YhaH (DUF805 family)|nr:DUF805 domain-containing protein [Zoogloeaceae bacterium]
MSTDAEVHYRIVFDGTLAPGLSREVVEANLAQLFQCEAAKLAPLFSGQRVTMKRGLSKAQAEAYLARVQAAGALAQTEAEPLPLPVKPKLALVEDEPVAAKKVETGERRVDPNYRPGGAMQKEKAPASGLSLVEDNTEKPAPANKTPEAAPAFQSKLTLADAPASPPKRETVRETAPITGQVPASAQVEAEDEDEPLTYCEVPWWGNFERLDRLRFLGRLSLGTLAGLGVAVWAVFFSGFPSLFRAFVMFSALLAALFWAGMQSSRRLHDFNALGAGAWLLLVPLANLVLLFILLFRAGDEKENDYGDPPPPHTPILVAGSSVLGAAAGLASLLAIIFAPLVMAQIKAGYQQETQQAQQGNAYSPQSPPVGSLAEFAEFKKKAKAQEAENEARKAQEKAEREAARQRRAEEEKEREARRQREAWEKLERGMAEEKARGVE